MSSRTFEEPPLLERSNPHYKEIMGSAPTLVMEKPWDEEKLPQKSMLQKVHDTARWALIETFYIIYASVIQVSLDSSVWFYAV